MRYSDVLNAKIDANLKGAAESAASKALRNPKNSKAAKTARGSALNQR